MAIDYSTLYDAYKNPDNAGNIMLGGATSCLLYTSDAADE